MFSNGSVPKLYVAGSFLVTNKQSYWSKADSSRASMDLSSCGLNGNPLRHAFPRYKESMLSCSDGASEPGRQSLCLLQLYHHLHLWGSVDCRLGGVEAWGGRPVQVATWGDLACPEEAGSTRSSLGGLV